MQFEYSHKIGTDYATVTFGGQFLRFKPVVAQALISKFEKLGGEFETDNYCICRFEKHITVEMIKKAIHNTCYECGGLMKDDLKDVNHIAAIPIRKCTVCGHSHT